MQFVGDLTEADLNDVRKKHTLKDVLACDDPWSQTQTLILVVGCPNGTGEHGCRINGSRAFVRMLRRGDVIREGSPIRRRVSISFPVLRSVNRLLGQESCGTARYACIALMVSFTLRRCRFSSLNRFWAAAAVARDRFLSFAVWPRFQRSSGCSVPNTWRRTDAGLFLGEVR